MGALFLSYRRLDSQDVVGRIYDHLIEHFPASAIFRDLDSIPPGKPFPEVLEDALTKTSVGLVVIGPRWLSITNDEGTRRLDNPADFVRREVESLLAMDIPVIPCLVSNARMPAPGELPESIRPLVYRSGVQVRPDPDFHRDMEHLIAKIGAFVLDRHPNEDPLCAAFKAFVEKLEAATDDYIGQKFKAKIDHLKPPLIVEAENKNPILQWIDSLDDELLEATLAIREYWRGRHWADGVPLNVLSRISHSSGTGRSVTRLQQDLTEVGVLGGADDRLPAGNVHYGRNLQRALDCIDLADWQQLRIETAASVDGAG